MVQIEEIDFVLNFLIAIITILTIIIGVFQWKINQIKKNTASDVSGDHNIKENHQDINQLKQMVITLQTSISDLCDRISRLEGAFSQHNRESNK